MKKYPDIDLKMSEVGANIVQTQVNSGSIDIGIVVLPMLNTENYNVIPAMTADNALIVNKDHPLASREEVSFKELEHEDFLILDGTYMLHDSIIRNCEIAGFLSAYCNGEFPVGFPGGDGSLQSGNQYSAGSDYETFLFQ